MPPNVKCHVNTGTHTNGPDPEPGVVPYVLVMALVLFSFDWDSSPSPSREQTLQRVITGSSSTGMSKKSHKKHRVEMKTRKGGGWVWGAGK